ncbi:hypothetical protein CAAN1_03S04874 [[Candida] anglica]|uniref:Uncharacterized protein n=1 Tax=[Candida] anglica TaxID=148631 RepID=A0ABP0EIP3_9ASCO
MSFPFQSGDDVKLLQQEKEATLKVFNNAVAWEIGQLARQKVLAKNPNASAVIDISLLTGHKLFRAAVGSDTALDNESWVERKVNVVRRFNHSSFYHQAKLTCNNKPNTLNEAEYAIHGGSFPIRLQNSDFVIATLTVSGLKQNEDHEIVYETLKEIGNSQ